MRGLKTALTLAAALMLGAPAAIGQSGSNAAPVAIRAGQSADGELSMNSAQLPSGKYQAVYVLQGQRGQRVALDLHSDDFDSYLVVTGPDGFSLANDDAPNGGDSLDSRIVAQLPADGAYRVLVTTYRPGETGRYRLRASLPPANMPVTTADPAQPIQFGAVVTGRLAQGDARMASGEFTDRYRFTARRGQRVRIDLTAPKFDTYLILRHPDGSQDDNDDLREEDGQTSLNSRIDRVLPEDGEYVVTVTSYRPGATGEYRLAVGPSPGIPRQNAVQGGARVLAILVGVSDYGGRTSNLPNTDADARELYNSLRGAGLLHPASVLLTNEQATTKAVQDAFARAARAAGPNDLFLFFFSGHGNQVDVPVSPAELDGRSETIELRDAAMRDVELGQLFDTVHARMEMVVLDSCFSGGFRNLINRPNVMGLFSSEEDLTSLVASRFKAGGFLAYFLREGMTGDADMDGDRLVTAGELSDYVRRRFRREGEIPADTREDVPGTQNLIVERGGLRVDDGIVRLAGGERLAQAVPQPAPIRVPAAPARDFQPEVDAKNPAIAHAPKQD
jgi:hypothetical protein